MAPDLSQKRCVPCEGGAEPMGHDEAVFLLEDQGLREAGWRLEGDAIVRDVEVKDFMAAVSLVRDIADLAEDEGHHPDLLIHGYKNLRITLTTHAIDGLSENDFIVATKAERIIAHEAT